MLTFLFWNMGGELPVRASLATRQERSLRLQVLLRNLVVRHDVDFLLLAECPLRDADVLSAVNHDPRRLYREPDATSLCHRVKIFPRYSGRFLVKRDESAHYTGRLVRLPARDAFLLFVVHFGSKRFQRDESQSQAMPGFSAIIRQREIREKHSRTIVVGDFNMNPFETGMASAEGLNAVMTRDVAGAESRTLHNVAHPFFYNPMWSHFGDSTHEHHGPDSPEHSPAGTCFYSASESKWFFWNMLDQVMLRPALLERFRNDSLRILTTDGASSLLGPNGRPSRTISDHLPLLFAIDI